MPKAQIEASTRTSLPARRFTDFKIIQAHAGKGEECFHANGKVFDPSMVVVTREHERGYCAGAQ